MLFQNAATFSANEEQSQDRARWLMFCVPPLCNLIMTKMYVIISRVNKRMQETRSGKKRTFSASYSPKPLMDQCRSRRVDTRLPPGILVDKIRSHQLLGDKSYFVPKFQEGYAYKHAASGADPKVA